MKLFLSQGRGTPISYCKATDLGHFGAPFLLPALREMCETHPVLCETFSKVPAVAGGTDCWCERLRETFGIGRY